ncbi:MAG TPA: protein kinase, partial [Gemmataceae bacterium]|nr:protein kinase [Gemmataceae bacterium]
ARLGNNAPATPTLMADALVRDGLLTRFQADQVLRGRWRNFILCGKYTILEPLGAGGMGTVYLCTHNIMHRPVAIKVLPASQAAEPGAVERFHREAQAVAQLRHPNIVGAYDVDRDGKFHFLVMEYVDGISLQDLVKRCGPLEPIRAAHYVHQAALGLEHAHQAGLVHRDIKPANLLVDRTGVVKILDLGLVRFFRDMRASLTEQYDGNTVLGTADYLAPEQAVDSHNVDIRCDIYSLGITFYFLLAGRCPYQEGSVAEKLIWHQVRRPTPIRELRPETPEGLAAILDRMIAKDPGQRYQTPADLAQALAPFTQTPIAAPSAEELPPITSGARRAGVTGSDPALPRLPSPSTPTPQPMSAQIEVNTQRENRTVAIAAGPVTMKSPAAPSTQDGLPPATDSRVPRPRRFPWPIAAAVAAGLFVLIGVGIAVGLGWFRQAPVAVVAPVQSVSIVRRDDGVHVKAPSYEAALGTDGCLMSFRVGGVEFLRPGEALTPGKSTARGAYFYSDKPPYLGVVPLPQIEQPAANIVKASGDKFSVEYEFLPDVVQLQAADAADFAVPFFFVLDSAPVTDVVNGKGEQLTVPVFAYPDPKWAATTWKAGRAALRIDRIDGGDVNLWGPFGQARSQVWMANVAGNQTCTIQLRPSVALEQDKPTVPPGGVLIIRQGRARRVQTDLYETVLDADGCFPSLRIDGVEFFKSGVSISRGAYFLQRVPLQLPDIVQGSPTLLGASGKSAGLLCDFGPSKLTWSLENRTDAQMAFFIVFDSAVAAVRNGKDEWLKTPIGDVNGQADPKWAKTTWYAGPAKMTITGGSRVWGPWEQHWQVWEATLAAREKRQVVIETARTTADEAKQAAATAGVEPPKAP